MRCLLVRLRTMEKFKLSVLRCCHRSFQSHERSNYDDSLEDVMEELALPQYFDKIVNSYRIGHAKPDLEAFTITLDLLKAKPQNV